MKKIEPVEFPKQIMEKIDVTYNWCLFASSATRARIGETVSPARMMSDPRISMTKVSIVESMK